MTIVQLKKENDIAVVTMCNGANRQNMVFAEQMIRCLDKILEDKTLYSMVLTSSDEKNFSQGIDLEWLKQKFEDQDFVSIKTFMYAMNTVFKRSSSNAFAGNCSYQWSRIRQWCHFVLRLRFQVHEKR